MTESKDSANNANDKRRTLSWGQLFRCRIVEAKSNGYEVIVHDVSVIKPLVDPRLSRLQYTISDWPGFLTTNVSFPLGEVIEARYLRTEHGQLMLDIPRDAAIAISVEPCEINGDLWIQCPNCGFRFNASDKSVFDHRRHLRCGQLLLIHRL